MQTIKILHAYSVLTYDAEDDFISRNAYVVVLFRLFDILTCEPVGKPSLKD